MKFKIQFREFALLMSIVLSSIDAVLLALDEDITP